MILLATDWNRNEALSLNQHYLNIGHIVSYDIRCEKFTIGEFESTFKEFYKYVKTVDSLYTHFEITELVPYDFGQDFSIKKPPTNNADGLPILNLL